MAETRRLVDELDPHKSGGTPTPRVQQLCCMTDPWLAWIVTPQQPVGLDYGIVPPASSTARRAASWPTPKR
jgi:hypothetical protein